MDLVREFLTASFAAAGAVVENTPDGIEALLPPDVAGDLGLPEEVRITLGVPSGHGSAVTADIDGGLGSALVDRIVTARLASPALAAVAAPPELPQSLPTSLPVLFNAIQSAVVDEPPQAARYLVIDVCVVLEGDERRTELTTVCLRLDDGARVSALRLFEAYPVAVPGLSEEERRRVVKALSAFVQRDAPVVLGGALEALVRRARRDLERLAEYYANLDAEMARAAARARTPEERARREAKRAALPEDLAARREQLRRRLSPRLSTHVVAATLVQTDRQRYVIRVRRRAREGQIGMYRRACDNVFEGPACAACGRETVRFYLCDERLHVLCERCGQPGRLDPPRCSACSRTSPPAPALSIPDSTAGLRLGEA